MRYYEVKGHWPLMKAPKIIDDGAGREGSLSSGEDVLEKKGVESRAVPVRTISEV